jgi:PAS domain S-box-containing protein
MNSELPGRAGDHAATADQRGIDLAPVGLLIADGDGRVTAANQTWSEMSGLSGPESTGDGFLTALDPAERAALRDEIRRAGRGDELVSGDHYLAGPHRRWTRWWLRRQDHGQAARVVMAVGDVSVDGSAPAGSDAPAALPIEVADTLILRLNAIAYTLASSARMIDHQAAARIGQAIADLDRVIDDLRTTQAQPGPGRPTGPGTD